MHRSTPPPPVWRWLGIAAVTFLAGSVLAIALISASVFDPHPVGNEVGRRKLEPVSVSGEARRLSWLSLDLDGAPFSARLVAAHEQGEPDAAYGLAVAAGEESLVAAVSPLGYAAVWIEDPRGEMRMLLPWQPWPHVRTGQEENEIQVDVTDGAATVRINRERLWEGAWAPGRKVGLFLESFGGPATIDFRELRLFQE